jgi:Tfp pilus assembly protein FimT
MFPRENSKQCCSGGCVSRPLSLKSVKERGSHGALRSQLPVRCRTREDESTLNSVLPGFTLQKQRERVSAFTLLELLIVVGIIALLLVLLAPAFTTIKSGGDVTSAAYTIKGVLDTARTYAKANNTYTWVGFYEENVSSPASPNGNQPAVGRVIMSIVASKDGTDLGTSVNITGTSDITANVTPVSKIVKIENIHIGDTGTPTNDGTEFESRPAVLDPYRVSSSGDTDYPFTVQGVTFLRWIRFSPRGEAVVKGGDTQIARYAEVGLLPTHGTTLAAAINPASGNLVAIQISGFGGNVRIYRR